MGNELKNKPKINNHNYFSMTGIILIFSAVALFLTALMFFLKGIPSGATVCILFASYLSGVSILYFSEPKAIDVYRGNTSLEITYMDGVPVDSVVVLKRK